MLWADRGLLRINSFLLGNNPFLCLSSNGGERDLQINISPLTGRGIPAPSFGGDRDLIPFSFLVASIRLPPNPPKKNLKRGAMLSYLFLRAGIIYSKK